MMKNVVVEGVEFDPSENSFSFDFNVDGENSIVRLKEEIYQIREYLPCTYFGYTFAEDVDKSLKPKFIDAIKYPNQASGAKISEDDLDRFLNNAISRLNSKVGLANYDAIVYPQSSSKLNKILLEKISDISMSKDYATFEIVKDLPKNISIDVDRYLAVNHTLEKDQQSVIDRISEIERNIRKLDYLKLGKDVKPKYRKFLRNFYRFKSDEDKKTFKALSDQSKILVLDDVATTGSTLKYVLNAIRIVNNVEDSKIAIFCVLGNRK